MPTIGIRVSEELKEKYDILNKHPMKLGTMALKRALISAIEEYSWWFEEYEKIRQKALLPHTDEDVEELINVSEEEILSEIG